MTEEAQRRIWLVADDYGISPAVSAAIRDLIARGRLSATSVMTSTPSFSPSEAAALLDVAGSRAAIGLHVTLTGAVSAADAQALRRCATARFRRLRQWRAARSRICKTPLCSKPRF